MPSKLLNPFITGFAGTFGDTSTADLMKMQQERQKTEQLKQIVGGLLESGQIGKEAAIKLSLERPDIMPEGFDVGSLYEDVNLGADNRAQAMEQVGIAEANLGRAQGAGAPPDLIGRVQRSLDAARTRLASFDSQAAADEQQRVMATELAKARIGAARRSNVPRGTTPQSTGFSPVQGFGVNRGGQGLVPLYSQKDEAGNELMGTIVGGQFSPLADDELISRVGTPREPTAATGQATTAAPTGQAPVSPDEFEFPEFASSDYAADISNIPADSWGGVATQNAALRTLMHNLSRLSALAGGETSRGLSNEEFFRYLESVGAGESSPRTLMARLNENDQIVSMNRANAAKALEGKTDATSRRQANAVIKAADTALSVSRRIRALLAKNPDVSTWGASVAKFAENMSANVKSVMQLFGAQESGGGNNSFSGVTEADIDNMSAEELEAFERRLGLGAR